MFKKFKLLILLITSMIFLSFFASNAVALNNDQIALINAAVATCDTEQIEAAAKKIVQEIIAAGEETENTAKEVTDAAVKAALVACKDVDAVMMAAQEGVTKGLLPEEPEAFEPAKGAGTPSFPASPSIEIPPTQDHQPASPV